MELVKLLVVQAQEIADEVVCVKTIHTTLNAVMAL
jgi:hypothetical protein